MNTLKLASLAIAIVGAISMQSANAGPMNMSAADKEMMNSCMSMSESDMMNNGGCMDWMKRMNMSSDDMKMVMTCRGMGKDAMMKDAQCNSMMKMHPDMMKM